VRRIDRAELLLVPASEADGNGTNGHGPHAPSRFAAYVLSRRPVAPPPARLVTSFLPSPGR